MWRGRKEHFCHLNSPVDDISVVKKKFAMFGEVHCYKHTHTNNVMSDIVGGTERHGVLGAVADAGSRDWIAQTQCRSSLRRFLGGLTGVQSYSACKLSTEKKSSLRRWGHVNDVCGDLADAVVLPLHVW